MAQFEEPGVRDGVARGEGGGVEGVGGGGGDGGVRGGGLRDAGWHLPLAARVFISRRGRLDRSSVAEVPPSRAARGRVVLSHSSLDWQRRLDPKDSEHLSFVDGAVLLLSRYPQRNW